MTDEIETGGGWVAEVPEVAKLREDLRALKIAYNKSVDRVTKVEAQLLDLIRKLAETADAHTKRLADLEAATPFAYGRADMMDKFMKAVNERRKKP